MAALAIALRGGGARAAYQAGVLRRIGREFPHVDPPILIGESAGAINAAYLAAQPGDLGASSERLARLWSGLTAERIFRVEGYWLIRNAARWAARLVSGGLPLAPEVRGLLDTAPLRALLGDALGATDGELAGIARKVEAGRLAAVALTTIDYASGDTVTWVQGRRIQNWERPGRRSVQTRLSVDTVMASAALPYLFPAVPLGGGWHGDGGVRLHAPLSPAVHLGASRILAVSTRPRSRQRSALAASKSHPPPAQIAGILLNAIFLDLLDQDALNLRRVNALLSRIPPGERDGLHPIDLMVIRPSQDVAALAPACEACLPRGLRFMTRGLGTREASSPELLSMLMFEPGYLQRLIEIGEADAEARMDEIARFVAADDASGSAEGSAVAVPGGSSQRRGVT